MDAKVRHYRDKGQVLNRTTAPGETAILNKNNELSGYFVWKSPKIRSENQFA